MVPGTGTLGVAGWWMETSVPTVDPSQPLNARLDWDMSLEAWSKLWIVLVYIRWVVCQRTLHCNEMIIVVHLLVVLLFSANRSMYLCEDIFCTSSEYCITCGLKGILRTGNAKNKKKKHHFDF